MPARRCARWRSGSPSRSATSGKSDGRKYPGTIPVTADKSHSTVLGEKLYAESIELLRALVNNAFDADATEVREENAVYLNADHPLFERESDHPRSFTVLVARLFAQEIALMQNPRNPRKAFELQSRILREAFREEATSEQ